MPGLVLLIVGVICNGVRRGAVVVWGDFVMGLCRLAEINGCGGFVLNCVLGCGGCGGCVVVAHRSCFFLRPVLRARFQHDRVDRQGQGGDRAWVGVVDCWGDL